MSNQGTVSERHVDHVGMTVPIWTKPFASSKTLWVACFSGV